MRRWGSTASANNVNELIVVMGDIMMDIAIKPHGPIRVASDTESTIRLGVGGTGANTAIHLARLDMDTLLLARHGEDDLGRLARKRLRIEGVRLPDAPCAGVATGAIGVLVDANGQRTMFPQRGANDHVTVEFVQEHWPSTPRSDPDVDADPDARIGFDAPTGSGVRALFVSGYVLFRKSSRAAALWAMERARAAGVPVIVDPASYALIDDVGADNFLRWIASATVLLPNREEAAVLAAAVSRGPGRASQRGGRAVGAAALSSDVSGEASSNEARMAARPLAKHFPVVVVTVDKDGAFIRAGDDEWHVPSQKVPVVDTTGAGDAFNAGFLCEYTAGASLQAAVGAGNRLAAQVVQQIGPT